MSKNTHTTRPTSTVAALAAVVGQGDNPVTNGAAGTGGPGHQGASARKIRIDDTGFLTDLLLSGPGETARLLAPLSPAQHTRVVEMLEKAGPKAAAILEAARKCAPVTGRAHAAEWGIGEAREFMGQLSGASPWIRCPVEKILPGFNAEAHGKPGKILVTPRKDAKGETYLEIRSAFPAMYLNK